VAENHFDKASRFAAKLDPPAFLGWALGLSADAFVFRGWLDTRDLPFPGAPDRVSDTVAHLENVSAHGVPWAVAVEFQLQPDPDMFGRVMGYLSGVWLNRKPDDERGSRFHLGAVVVNLTGSGTASRDMSWPESGLRTQLGIAERNLERESAIDLLMQIEAGRWSRSLLPWVPLMSGGGEADIIVRWKALATAEPNSRRKAELGGLALVLADGAGHKDIWKQQLEGWNVTESSIVNEWMAIAEARGATEEARAIVFEFGAKKFGPATAAITAALQGIVDHERLRRIRGRIDAATDWNDLISTP
jgi:hypothetical protein